MSVSPMRKIQIVAAALLLLAFAAPLPAQTDLGCRTMVPLAAAGRPKPAFADYAPAPGSSFWCALDKVTYQTALMTACNVASFCPQGPVTREAMAVSLLNGLFPSTVGAQQAPFPSAAGLFGDVPADYPLACWIEKLYQAGVTSGCAGSPGASFRFCPAEPLLRSQMAVFLVRARHFSGSQPYTPPPCTGIFDDVPCPSQFADWIERAHADGITTGCADNPLRYCPDEPVTRADMTLFLQRTFFPGAC